MRLEAPTGVLSVVGLRAGVDRVEIADFKRSVEVAGSTFLGRVFTNHEITYCAGHIERLAARFAAKEGMLKLLGTGARGIGWQEVEVEHLPSGEPCLILHERAQARARALRITDVAVSLTHTQVAAEAFLVAATQRSPQSIVRGGD